MKLADAAAEYWSTLDEVQAHAPAQRRFDKACEELKKGMAAAGVKTFRGIELVVVEGGAGERLDTKLLEAKYGSGLDDCRIARDRRSLVPKRRPRAKAAEVKSDG